MSLNRYPKQAICDFRKLKRDSLIKLLIHYGIPEANCTNLPDSELANSAAKIFMTSNVVEKDAIDTFMNKYCLSYSDPIRENFYSNNNVQLPPVCYQRMILDSEAPKIGEQIAARASDGIWIIGNIVDYDNKTQMYVVNEEDDPNQVMRLYYGSLKQNYNNINTVISGNKSAIKNNKNIISTGLFGINCRGNREINNIQNKNTFPRQICRLYDHTTHLVKGDRVYAVYPNTNTFYPAVVVRHPRFPSNNNQNKQSHNQNTNNNSWTVIVRFDGEGSDNRAAIPRRIPARFVLLANDLVSYSNEIDDDEGNEC